jgi:hypothetical protein
MLRCAPLAYPRAGDGNSLKYNSPVMGRRRQCACRKVASGAVEQHEPDCTQVSNSVAGLCVAAPVWASGGMAIPEPTDLTLLALGLAGLIIGRRGAKRPRQD